MSTKFKRITTCAYLNTQHKFPREISKIKTRPTSSQIKKYLRCTILFVQGLIGKNTSSLVFLNEISWTHQWFVCFCLTFTKYISLMMIVILLWFYYHPRHEQFANVSNWKIISSEWFFCRPKVSSTKTAGCCRCRRQLRNYN